MQNSNSNKQKVALKLEGLHCQNCVNSVTKALQKLAGISDFSVTVTDLECVIDTNLIKVEDIKNIIDELGFEAV